MPGEYRKRELIGDRFIVTHTIDNHHEGCRADQYLKKQYHYRSRNQIQKAIEAGRIVLSGKNHWKRLKPSTLLQSGDEIQISTTQITAEPVVDLNYKTLFEDDHVLVLDKPGNLPVHPAGRFLFNTMLSHLRQTRADWVCPEKERDFYLIHRLDRETSGVIVLAKRKKSASRLIKDFFDRKTEKRYFAITDGHCENEQFEVELDIGPATGSHIRLKMGTYPKGFGEDKPESSIQHAHSKFRVLERSSHRDLVECQLLTGRQHQIRVHLAAKGTPVLGDKLYGRREDLFLRYIETGFFSDEMKEAFVLNRHALHSCYLKFQHPETLKWLEIESPLPMELKNLI